MGKFLDGSRVQPWVPRSAAFVLGIQGYHYAIRQGSIEDLAAAVFFIREAEKRGVRVRNDFPGEALIVREMMESRYYGLKRSDYTDQIVVWLSLVDGKRLVVEDLHQAIVFGANPDLTFWPQLEESMTGTACEIFVGGKSYPFSIANLCFFLQQAKAA